MKRRAKNEQDSLCLVVIVIGVLIQFRLGVYGHRHRDFSSIVFLVFRAAKYRDVINMASFCTLRSRKRNAHFFLISRYLLQSLVLFQSQIL